MKKYAEIALDIFIVIVLVANLVCVRLANAELDKMQARVNALEIQAADLYKAQGWMALRMGDISKARR